MFYNGGICRFGELGYLSNKNMFIYVDFCDMEKYF